MQRPAGMRAAFENVGPDPTPPEPQFETQDLSFHEAVSAARDPDVAAVALPMPIKLIMPFDYPRESQRRLMHGASPRSKLTPRG
jgi:hypothetical protein